MNNKYRITFCQMTLNSIGQTAECIKRIQPYVDRVVIVDGGSVDGTIPTLRAWEGVELYIHPWTADDFSKQRNICLEHCGENGGTDFILFTDPDEPIPEETAKNLQTIIKECSKEYTNYLTLVRLRCRDIGLRGGAIVDNRQTNFFKPLFFRHHPDNRYNGKVHEGLKLGVDGHESNTMYEYHHTKQVLLTQVCGARNLFMGGGIIDTDKKDSIWGSKWLEFMSLVKNSAGITVWNEFNKYLIFGNINQDIKDLIIKNRDENGYEGASNWMDLYFTYFRVYHPEEEPRELWTFQPKILPWCASKERQEVCQNYQDFIDGKNPNYVEIKNQ